MNNQGTIIISLDFELNWGVHDVFTLQQYEGNILGAREAIPKILEIFNKFNIHATWAMVGLLGFDTKNELVENLPTVFPSYSDARFSPYLKLDTVGENEEQDPLHYGLSLLTEINRYPNQEIGSHTFSHYYCLEKGQTIEEFEEDLVASRKLGIAKGHQFQSLVLPRNQTNISYLEVCRKNGITSYRGNEKSWVYRASAFHNEGIIKRFLRLSDHYLNIFGHHTYPLANVDIDPIVNLPSSRFLRPYNSRLKIGEPLRINRIKKSIKHAAEKGEVFHLWWHPHNFGRNINENLSILTEILQHVAEMSDIYDFRSMNMGEASAFVREYLQM